MEPCRSLARQLGADHAVEFRGAMPFDTVRQELQRASVFVQHSITASDGDREGWPVAIAEAAGSGLPVIATRHASIPEQIDDGRTGLLFEEGDWRAMGAAMTILAMDPARRRAMGEAARKKMAQFDLPRQLSELQDFLWECAFGRSTSARARAA
jgi:glycosyltransferase involved in cell wall biosynthesis